MTSLQHEKGSTTLTAAERAQARREKYEAEQAAAQAEWEQKHEKLRLERELDENPPDDLSDNPAEQTDDNFVPVNDQFVDAQPVDEQPVDESTDEQPADEQLGV